MQKQTQQLSIIIPVYNEAHSIASTLDAVSRLRGSFEVIVVDGISEDGTDEILRTRNDVNVIKSERGRGVQMHAGAMAASGDVFWFLHADTIPPVEAIEKITEALNDKHIVGGNFHIHFDGTRRAAKFLTWLYPQLRKLGLIYGDSAIFVRRDAYEKIGGFKPFPLFEDLDLVQRLKRIGRITHLDATVTTSSRRFENKNFTLVFARWSLFQLLYWLGISPNRLGRRYASVRIKDSKRIKDKG